ENEKERLPAYLKACPDKVKKWSQKIDHLAQGRFKIGIAWYTITNQRRTINLSEWLPLLAEKNIMFFNLQYPPTQKQLEQLKQYTNITIHDLGVDQYDDIDDMAAITKSLDMVISSQNSIVHLAGALGVPTWVLLPYGSDWRWEIESERMRWYRSVKMFRQTSWNNWTNVIHRVRKHLLSMPPLTIKSLS
ncbi:MAG: hypothetical protein AAF403_09005, partial [Pseudomonadota bacterium]